MSPVNAIIGYAVAMLNNIYIIKLQCTINGCYYVPKEEICDVNIKRIKKATEVSAPFYSIIF